MGEDLDEDDRRALRELWLEEGGDVDGVREFHALARRSGIQVSFRETSAFLRFLGMPPEVERRIDALWADRQSSARELFDRAKREKIPVTWAQIEKYVKEAADRTAERFQAPKQTGKAFANEPWSEWKVDVVYATTRPSPPFRYILIRINSFSREVDAEPLETLQGPDVADGLEALLKRCSTRPPRVMLTDMGSEFTRGDVQDVLRDNGGAQGEAGGRLRGLLHPGQRHRPAEDVGAHGGLRKR
jgi:transposase InsO family protein